MKSRRPHIGARERLRAWLVELDQRYGAMTPQFAEQLEHLDAGEPTRCHGYEIDLPGLEWVEVDQDGRVTVLSDS